MAVDSNIPLSFNANEFAPAPGGPNINNLMSLAEAAGNLRQQQAGVAKENALKTIFSDPSSYNPNNGGFTPQAIQKIGSVDPGTAMKVKQQTYDDQAQQFAAKLQQTEVGKQQHDITSGAAAAAVKAYDEAKTKSTNPQDWASAATQARDEYLDPFAPILGNDMVGKIRSTPFDIAKATAYASTNSSYVAEQQKAATEKRQDRAEAEKETHDAAMAKHGDAMVAALMAKEGDKPGQQETIKVKDKDGNISEVPAFVKGPGKVFDLAGNSIDPSSIVGASKIGSGGQPRSAGIVALQKYLSENPNATAADVQKFNARGVGQSSAYRSFMGGADGKQLQSLGVATDHLMTLRDLNQAFKGGDEKTLAAAKARWETEFGTPAPSNIDTAAQFVAPELIKAIQGSSGGVQEREDLVKKFSSARGQSNVDGAIDTAFAYMGGQLQGMHQKLVKTEKIISDDEFNDSVPSVARDAMAKHATHSSNSLDEKGESKPSPTFSSIEDAEKAAKSGKLKNGDKVTIGGRTATWQE